MGHFDIAQVCMNGHVITNRLQTKPEVSQKYCEKCGEATIAKCQHCQSTIHGIYFDDNVIILKYDRPAPSYCHECGKPYPWTQRKLQAAWELADELEELTDEEKQKLKNSLEDITRDTPKTELAITKLKKLLGKLGKESYQLVKHILIEIATEAAKKAIFGS